MQAHSMRHEPDGFAGLARKDALFKFILKHPLFLFRIFDLPPELSSFEEFLKLRIVCVCLPWRLVAYHGAAFGIRIGAQFKEQPNYWIIAITAGRLERLSPGMEGNGGRIPDEYLLF